MTQAYIGLGANLGDARHTLKTAAGELAGTAGVVQLTLSRFYRTAPVDSNGPDYVNAVASIQTSLTARLLFEALQQIERKHGRERPYRNAPRTLDLDLLLFGAQTICEPDLIVPHPRMHERAFVLKPLSDLAPDLYLAQGPLNALLAACAGQALALLPENDTD